MVGREEFVWLVWVFFFSNLEVFGRREEASFVYGEGRELLCWLEG